MAVTLTADVLQDDMAVNLARVMATANKHARELGVDVERDVAFNASCILGYFHATLLHRRMGRGFLGWKQQTCPELAG